jgi:hypothetical protein
MIWGARIENMTEYQVVKEIIVDTVTEAISLAVDDSRDVIETSTKHIDELFIRINLRIRAKIHTVE